MIFSGASTYKMSKRNNDELKYVNIQINKRIDTNTIKEQINTKGNTP